MNLNLPHLHLMLNHVPTVGTVIALGLLVTALVRKNDGLVRAALEVFYGVALLTLPAYVTGAAAQRVLADVPEVSADTVARHLDAAISGSVLMLLTGGVAWLALWHRRRGSAAAGTTRAVVALGALTLGLMGQAASIGGEIRHPEILVDGAPGGGGLVLVGAASVKAVIDDNVWVWPSLEALHFLGLAILFGVIVVVNARLLGYLPTMSYRAAHRLLPWAALALGMNTVSGMMFFIATPEQYADNISFHAKLVFLVLAGANLLYLTESEEPFRVGENDPAPGMVKAMAFSAIVFWIGVMYYGRMLPFIGGAF